MNTYWKEAKSKILEQFNEDELRQKLIKLYYEQYLCHRQIGEEFSVSRATIQRLFKKPGIPSRNRGTGKVKAPFIKLVTKDLLTRLYYQYGLSQQRIAEILGVSRRTVAKAFKFHGLTTRNRSEATSIAKTKIPRRPYDAEVDGKSIVEINALTHTDFSARKMRRTFRLFSSTTHLGQIIFFKKVIDNYQQGITRCSPRFKKNGFPPPYQWDAYADLHETFEQQVVTNGVDYLDILRNKELDRETILLYFTRAVECDGGIAIKEKHGKLMGEVFLESKNIIYLKKLGEIITKELNIPIYYCSIGNDMYRLWISLKQETLDILEEMPIIHPEKLWRKRLVLDYLGEHVTQELSEKIEALRAAIVNLRNITVEIAKERYERMPKGKRAIGADELIKVVLEHYYRRFGELPFPIC